MMKKILGVEAEGVIEVEYTLGQVIASIDSGSVRRCTSLRTRKEYACKVINKVALQSAEEVEQVHEEVNILQLLREEPNILTFRSAYEDENNVYIVTDVCSGGDLLQLLEAREYLEEREAAHFFAQVVRAVAACHAHGIVHRDIKPENILIEKPVSGSSKWRRATSSPALRVADFGLAARVPEGALAEGLVGSRMYMAPELAKTGRCGLEADIWSLGVTLYAMLSGTLPFTASQVTRTSSLHQVEFEDFRWESVSSQAKDLIARMLNPLPKRRPCAERVLSDPWLREALDKLKTAEDQALHSPAPPSLEWSQRSITSTLSSGFRYVQKLIL